MASVPLQSIANSVVWMTDWGNGLESESPTPTNDAPPDYDEAALLKPATPSPTVDSEEGMMEVKQPGEEEKEVETVLMNNDADDDEDEKKTDL